MPGDPLTCLCTIVGGQITVVNPECPIHGGVSGTGLPRYSLQRALRRLDQARDEIRQGGIAGAVAALILAVFHVIDYIRAKERGDI